MKFTGKFYIILTNEIESEVATVVFTTYFPVSTYNMYNFGDIKLALVAEYFLGC